MNVCVRACVCTMCVRTRTMCVCAYVYVCIRMCVYVCMYVRACVTVRMFGCSRVAGEGKGEDGEALENALPAPHVHNDPHFLHLPRLYISGPDFPHANSVKGIEQNLHIRGERIQSFKA